MKKTFCAILFIISLSNNAFSNHLNSQWGIVVSIKSIYHNEIVNVPTEEKSCKYVKQQNPRIENIIVGGIIGSVISAYYYLNIIKVMYLDELEESFTIDSKVSMKIILLISSLFILIFIVYADNFINFMSYISRAIVL